LFTPTVKGAKSVRATIVNFLSSERLFISKNGFLSPFRAGERKKQRKNQLILFAPTGKRAKSECAMIGHLSTERLFTSKDGFLYPLDLGEEKNREKTFISFVLLLNFLT